MGYHWASNPMNKKKKKYIWRKGKLSWANIFGGYLEAKFASVGSYKMSRHWQFISIAYIQRQPDSSESIFKTLRSYLYSFSRYCLYRYGRLSTPSTFRNLWIKGIKWSWILLILAHFLFRSVKMSLQIDYTSIVASIFIVFFKKL